MEGERQGYPTESLVITQREQFLLRVLDSLQRRWSSAGTPRVSQAMAKATRDALRSKTQPLTGGEVPKAIRELESRGKVAQEEWKDLRYHTCR